MPHADVNDTHVYYEMDGRGAALVLLHGFSVDARMWDSNAGVLRQGACVVRYDLRGFGRSALPGATSYAHADDLRALLDHLHIDRAVLVGLSMGGMVAAQFALAFPERTRALVLVDATVDGMDWSAGWRATWKRVVHAARTQGIDAAKEIWLGHPLFAVLADKPLVAAALRSMVTDYSGWHWVHDDPARYDAPSTAERLSEIVCPTLVMAGEDDLAEFQERAATLAEQIPGARRVSLRGAGHMSNMEAPEAFAAALTTFLRSVPPA